MIVGLTVDLDADSGFRDRNLGVVSLARGAYGPLVGVRRLLDLFAQFNLQATFFIPGEVVERFPDACKQVRDAGHEIGHHGYLHKSPLEFSLEEEKRDLERGLEAHLKTLGLRPKGYRAPWLGQSTHTYRLLSEYGFEYDSSEAKEDAPYFIPLPQGRLLEIPSKFELVDTLYFINVASQGLFPFPIDPDTVEKIWQREFTGMYLARQNLSYIHTVHPFCIGHFYRLKVYENLLSFMKNHTDVKFLTLDQLSRSIPR